MYRKLIGGLASTSLIAGLVTAGAVAGAVATATPALAAGIDVTIGPVEAQMDGHMRKQNNTGDNCIRFDPPDGQKTLWVNSTLEAAAGHGNRLSPGVRRPWIRQSLEARAQSVSSLLRSSPPRPARLSFSAR